ncbi:alpha/beta hydrolase family protein [Algihabitans sp.]|uniref:alpha/beta hydrolase family protein n=1 Tax=Algihabitans sp. TaxID=2821514 RepID=UPI003BA8E2FB
MSLKIVRRLLPDWGATYGPPGDGPFPAVLVLHGSEGAWAGWSHRNAVILAAHGFLAFPFGYSEGGNPWNAGSILDVPLDRTVEALAALGSFAVSGAGLGLYGVSRGAEHALLVASLMARDRLDGLPDAIAVHAPADVVCGAFRAAKWRDRGDPGWQVWDPAETAWTWRGSSEALRPTTPIEIERYPGPLFLSHGTDDTMWSSEMTRRLEQRLTAAGRHPEVHYYEGQDHMPDGPTENEHHAAVIEFFARHLRR